MVLAQLPPNSFDVVFFHHLILRRNIPRRLQVSGRSAPGARWLGLTTFPSHLLVFGDWVQQLHVQFGVVLRQRLVAIVVDELHDGAEGQWV